MYDSDYNVIGASRRRQRHRQCAAAASCGPIEHNNPEYSTILPCDFIKIGDWWHVAVMVTKGLGNELRTEFHRSRDLVNWEVHPELTSRHPSHPGNVMLTFDRIGDYVYIFGTGGLARDREHLDVAKPRRPVPATAWWEPWGWDGFRLGLGHPQRGHPDSRGRLRGAVLPLPAGQLRAVLLRRVRPYKQQARTVQFPEDDWRDGANVVDYAFGFEIPQLYGGYISPLSRLNEGGGMHFWVSQWNPHQRQLPGHARSGHAVGPGTPWVRHSAAKRSVPWNRSC